MKIIVAGQHTSHFGELWDKSLRDLLVETGLKAVQNSSFAEKEIEAIFVANKAGGASENQLHLGAMISQAFDHQPPAMRIEGACASGSLAIVAAEQALLAGRYKTVLVVGVEKMTDLDANENTRVLSGAADMNEERGSTFPGLYAMLAQAHINKFGTTREMLSSVAVKNHFHALDNPYAQYHKNFTVDQVSNSTLVADPLRLLDCSPISDGASAVVLTTKKIAGKPKLIAYGQGQDSLDLANRKSLTSLVATKQAAQEVFKIADLKPSQISVAEVHDCFTIAEILAIEDLGFFKAGEGGSATLEGLTSCKNKKAKVKVNASGGLKACGHPVGATGVKQIAFLAEYLQKHDDKYALAHNVGGSGATAVVHILEK
jgi:acetyl-CoA C-acetyltransferase